MPTHPRRLSVCPVPPFLRAPRFAHTLLCYLPSVTPLAHQPLNTHFLGLWFCTYTLFAHWYPLPRFMLGSLSWHTPSHVNTLICTFMICPPPSFGAKISLCTFLLFVQVHSCTLLALWFSYLCTHPTMEAHLFAHSSTLSTQDLTSRYPHVHTFHLRWDMQCTL